MHDFLYSPEEDPIGSGAGNDDTENLPLKDVSGLFNERGFYKSNGFNFNDEEIINDFSGNLIYNIPLYNYKLAGDLNFDMKLVYNGSVGHAIKIGDASTLETGIKNTFNMNMSEWMLSVNGICIQAFNFITKYFSKPTPPATNLEGHDINMLIPGYHYTNDWRNPYSTSSDTITLLMGDGSTVTLENENNSNDPEARYAGNYKGKGKENYIKAKVSYLPGSGSFDYRARKIVLLKGDGLEYVFNETKNEFIDFTDLGSTDKKPLMPLLMEINNRYGYNIKFNYTTAYNEGSGRPMISSILASGISSQQTSINFGFTFGPRTCLIEHQTNLNEWYDIKFEDEGVNYHHSNNGNKIGRVKQIKNCMNQTFDIEYNTNASDEYYQRKYLHAFDPFLHTHTLNINFNKLKRIRKIKNFLDLRRSYYYHEVTTLIMQIDVQFLYYDNPYHIVSPVPIFKGYGRDPFFTSMIEYRDEFYIEDGVKMKNRISYNYVYTNAPRDLRITPISENDDLITNKTTAALDDLNNNSSITTIVKNLKYKIYPLYDPNNHFAYSPDTDGTTKLIEEKTEYTSNSIVTSMEYEIGVLEPLTNGYNGSFLMKKKIETLNGILRQWEWEYVYKDNIVDKFIIESRENDPFGAKKIKKFKDFSVDFSRILFTNEFAPTEPPQAYTYFSYNMVEEEYIELISNPGVKNKRKKYYFIEATNDARGYIGQIIQEDLYENNSSNKIETHYLYSKNDRTGEGIFQASGIFPFKEGNLKEIKKPNGQITKYYYHPVSLDEVIIGGSLDEPDDIPFLKYLVKYNNNSVVEKSEKIWDHRLPIRTDNVKRIGSTDSLLLTTYKSYAPDGSPEKNIGYQKFVTEFKYMSIHRIKKITLPGDFSTLPDQTVITTIHDYRPVEKIVTSNKWGGDIESIKTYILDRIRKI